MSFTLTSPPLGTSRLLSPKSRLKRGTRKTGFASLSSSFSNFFNCYSPRETTSIYANYLRSHFSMSQPKGLRRRARGYLSKLHRASCLEKSHFPFCSPLSSSEFLLAVANFPVSTATGSNALAFSTLKHIRRSDLGFLLHIFNLYWSLPSFLFIWKSSFIIIDSQSASYGAPGLREKSLGAM